MRYAFILIALIATLKVGAQNLTYISGAKIENYDKIYFDLFQQDEDNLYAFNYTKPVYYLDLFGKKDLLQKAHIRIPLPSKDSIKFQLENLFVLKDRFIIFYSYYNKQAEATQLEMLSFDKSGTGIGDTKAIDELPGKNERKAGSFTVLDQPSRNEFLSYGYKKNKGKYYLNIDHFDYDGNKIKSQDFIIDNSRFLLRSFYNDENICRLEQDGFNEKKADWYLSFYSPLSEKALSININPPAETNVNISGKFLSFVDSSRVLHLLCPYTTGLFANKAKGLYMVTADLRTARMIAKKVIPFKIEATAEKEGADFSLASCIPTNIILLKNGMRVLFESRLLTTTYGVPTSYNLGNIVAVDIDMNNQVTDIKIIRKQQTTNPARVKYMGFTTLTRSDSTFCIYNELLQNMNDEGGRPKNVRGSKTDETVVIAATLAPQSVVKKNIIIGRPENNERDAVLIAETIKDPATGQLYILRQKGDDVWLTKIF